MLQFSRADIDASCDRQPLKFLFQCLVQCASQLASYQQRINEEDMEAEGMSTINSDCSFVFTILSFPFFYLLPIPLYFGLLEVKNKQSVKLNSPFTPLPTKKVKPHNQCLPEIPFFISKLLPFLIPSTLYCYLLQFQCHFVGYIMFPFLIFLYAIIFSRHNSTGQLIIYLDSNGKMKVLLYVGTNIQIFWRTYRLFVETQDRVRQVEIFGIRVESFFIQYYCPRSVDT